MQQVVKRHEGLIHVSSVLGEGTNFSVEIPLYQSSEEKMILERRGEVLKRAIASLENATPSTIKHVTHGIGGAIGFYRFEDLGREILEFSRSLPAEEMPLLDFAEQKMRLLELMRNQLEKI